LEEDLATANKPAKKTPNAQPIGTTARAKRSTPTVSKEHKVASKARTRGKLLVGSVVVVLVGGEAALKVVVAKTAT